MSVMPIKNLKVLIAKIHNCPLLLTQASQIVDNYVLEEESCHPSLGLHHHVKLSIALLNVVIPHLFSLKYTKIGNALFGYIDATLLALRCEFGKLLSL